MKNHAILLLLMLPVIQYQTAFAQEFNWAVKAGEHAFDYGYGVAGDNAGNVYIAGKFERNCFFDDTTRIQATGNHDIFTAKYSPGGDLMWVRTAGGMWGDYAHDITCDGDGNVYVTGEMELTIAFYGSDVTLSTWGGNDIFVAKYSTDGELLWAKRAGGRGSDRGYSITVDGEDLYIAGSFNDTAWFEDKAVVSAGDHDTYLTKYDTSGNVKWVRRGGGIDEDRAYGVSTGADGSIYSTGEIFDQGDFSGVQYTTKGTKDCFITKYDPDGNLIWLETAGGLRNDRGTAIAAGKDGRLYVTGGFREQSYFGDIFMTAKKGDTDIFTACYTSDGEAVWVKSAGGDINDRGEGITVDDSLHVYVTGYFGEGASFGNHHFTASDSSDIFVMSYDKEGNMRWVIHADGVKDLRTLVGTEEAGRDMWVDQNGNVLVTGSFRTDAAFGNIHLEGWEHTDIFLGKIQQYGDLDPITSVVDHSFESSFSIHPNPTGSALYINYTGENDLEVKVKIIAMQGNTVIEKNTKMKANSTEILHLENVSPGPYIISISSTMTSFMRKIIVRE